MPDEIPPTKHRALLRLYGIMLSEISPDLFFFRRGFSRGVCLLPCRSSRSCTNRLFNSRLHATGGPVLRTSNHTGTRLYLRYFPSFSHADEPMTTCARPVPSPTGTHALRLLRYREVHDLWHVLSGLPPTVEGELALKWFELVQTGLPVCALGAVVGPLALPRREPQSTLDPSTKSSPFSFSSASQREKSSGGGGSSSGKRGSREVLARTYVPWAIRAGRRAKKPLVCVWYEKRWEQPLEQIRRELGVKAAPRRGKSGGAPTGR